MATPRVVQIILTGNADQAQAEIAKLSATTEASSKNMTSSFLSVGKAATLGLVAGVAAAAVIGIKAAQEQEVATARLKQTMQNAGLSFREYGNEIEKAEKHAIDLGFADEQLDDSLSRLIPATKNVAQAVKDSNLAMDIARARHISLESATDALVKVEGGRYTALTRMLGLSKDVVAGFRSQQDALDYLTKTFGGQASTFTETFAGKIEVLKARLGEAAEAIGFALIPVVESLAGVLADSFGWLEKNQGVAIGLGIAIGGPLVAAMVAYVAVSLKAFATTGALGTAMTGLTTAGLEVAAAFESVGVALGAGGGLTGVAVGFAAIAAPIALVVAGGYALHLALGSALPDLKAAQEAGTKWGDNLVANASQIRDLTAQHDQYKAALRDVNATQVTSIEGAVKQKAAQDELNAALAQNEAAQKAANAAEKQRVADIVALANGTTTLANATDTAKTAIIGMQNAILGAQGGQIGYQQSVLNVQEAEFKLAELRASGTASAHDLQAAELAVQQAHLGVSTAALKLYDDQDKLQNLLKDGPGALVAIILKLREQQRATGDSSGAIQEQINKVQDMVNWWNIAHAQPNITKTITIEVQGNERLRDALNTLDRLNRQVGLPGITTRQAGGPVSSGQLYMVGERGPELFVPSTSGTILPNARGGTGGSNLAVTVNVGGSVISDHDLVNHIHAGLLEKQRAGRLGLN